MTTGELLRGLADSDSVGFRFGSDEWTYRQLVEEASRRAALFDDLRDRGRPPHIGVLLDNVPDYLFWLAAAALSGAVVVGINSTYRGDQLGLLVRHTDCQLLVTDSGFAPLLDGVDTGVAADRCCCDRRRRVRRRLRRRADDGAGRRGCARGGPVPPHLHVGLDGSAQGRAVHAGALHARTGVPRRAGRRARRGRRGLRAAAVLPLQRAVHGMVVGAQRRGPDRDAPAVLGVEHPARHPPLRCLDARLYRQGPELHPGHARAARRRRQPAAAGARQRGVDPRHPRVRASVRLPCARQLRLDRGHHHHPPRSVDARRRARLRPSRR